MKKKLMIRILLLGFGSWLIPFAVSFLFYKPGGELVVPYSTFKSVIMLVGVISGCYLLILFFRAVENNFVMNAVIAGLSWFVINIILDSLVLIPMMKSNFVDYFMSIGLSYIAIPVISITMGYLLERKVK